MNELLPSASGSVFPTGVCVSAPGRQLCICAAAAEGAAAPFDRDEERAAPHPDPDTELLHLRDKQKSAHTRLKIHHSYVEDGTHHRPKKSTCFRTLVDLSQNAIG